MAKKTDSSFFTKLLIVSAILLGSVLSYSYIIGNSIQPQLGVVEKIYMGIFSSADTLSGENKEINIGFDLKSSIEVKQDNSSIFDGSILIKNAQLFSNASGLEQKISAENIQLKIDNAGKVDDHNIKKLEIISQNENIYVSAGKGLDIFFKYISGGKNSEYNELIKNISQVNDQGNYAHIDNAKPIKEALGGLDTQHLVIKLLTTLVTSNPKEYFKQEKLGNLLKQRLYNDKWIDYFFIENKKIAEDNKQFFIVNPQICKEISPFLENINISGRDTNNSNINSYENCIKTIKEINPFINLISQVYKFGDIKNGNYDFVISQGTQIDMRLTYSNHILQTWTIFIQDPDNIVNISMHGDKFGIKESQLTIDYKKNKSNITGSIINGTGDISIRIDNKDQQILGNIIFQKYLLVDMDVKGRGETDKGNMRFNSSGDFRSGKIDYTLIKEKETIDSLNLKYADKNYKIDYMSPTIDFNSLYATGKFILGYSNKSVEVDMEEELKVEKEIKYVYDQGSIKGHYRTRDFEGNLKGRILSGNTFQLELAIQQQNQELDIMLEAKEISASKIEYKAEGKIEDETLFIFSAERTTNKDNTIVNADIKIPIEKIEIIFESELEQIAVNNNYEIPRNYKTLDIELNQIISLPNIHGLMKIGGPELTFAGASIATAAGTMSYLSLQGNTREDKNNKIKSDIEIINQAIARAVSEENFDIKTLINQLNTDNKDIGIRIGGDKIYLGNSYSVGTINYELLALDKKIIETEEIIYLVAIIDLGENKNYQILGHLEETGGKQRVIVQGNYIPRKFVRYEFDVIIGEDIDLSKKQTSIQIKLKGEHDLRVGDMTNLGRILDIEGQALFIENAVNPDITKVYLLGNDSPTLFIHKNKALENGKIIIKK